jgi:hypothetical protein
VAAVRAFSELCESALSGKKKKTSIAATTVPRNATMVINQIICSLALKPTTVPRILQERLSFAG